jgi:hypothetical protein
LTALIPCLVGGLIDKRAKRSDGHGQALGAVAVFAPTSSRQDEIREETTMLQPNRSRADALPDHRAPTRGATA